MKTASGWLNGFIGVAIFSGSLPATRIAVMDIDPLFITCARAVLATGLANALLMAFRERRPTLTNLLPLTIVSLGVVIGFPLLTAMALQHISSAHSVVFLGLLPLSTAFFGVIRGGERPRPVFWLFALLGSACVMSYAIMTSNGGSTQGNLLMLAAIVVCGLGYAEGASLSRTLGGWQVISWALVLALPVMIPLLLFSMPTSFDHVGVPAWISLAYVSFFSMLIGFLFWYRGLAQGGIAAVGQLQLIQPFMAFGLAALFLRETISAAMLLTTAGAVICIVGARKFAK